MLEPRRFRLFGSSRFRGFFNGICVLVLIFLFYNQQRPLQNPFSLKLNSKKLGLRGRSIEEIHNVGNDANSLHPSEPESCTGLYDHAGYDNRCEFLIAHPNCSAGGLFDYIRFFYCGCQNFTFVGYLTLGIWLVALFYLLGNTAADYFCCSLERLSNLLKLPPTVAGVSLLPLGNGAPDVFASIAAFVGKDAGEVGLNSVLGGGVFVTCVVVGVISLLVAEKGVRIDKRCFIRDVSFYLFTLVLLGVILMVGQMTVGGALAFVSIYLVYAFAVAANEILRKQARMLKLDAVMPLFPAKGSIFSHLDEEDDSAYPSLMESEVHLHEIPHLENNVPHWMWASHFAIFSNDHHKPSVDSPKHVWGWNDEELVNDGWSCSCIFEVLEFPLTIFRRLTIPIVEDERWSKGYAVASASLAPVLLVLLWNSQDDLGKLDREISFFVGFSLGGVLGILAFTYTSVDGPPKRFLLLWVLGGFFMSIIWFYMVANELVALFLSFGTIFEINPAILGVTVLAWGNSMGDLMSNIALAMNGGDSAQVAMSGCYAGPMFNTLAGLGISMLLGAWSSTPKPYMIPQDKGSLIAMAFLILGLIWSLLILPQNSMRPNKTLGIGLITIYSTFLIYRLIAAMGVAPW